MAVACPVVLALVHEEPMAVVAGACGSRQLAAPLGLQGRGLVLGIGTASSHQRLTSTKESAPVKDSFIAPAPTEPGSPAVGAAFNPSPQ
jgi:hypothetical protein